ncbi:MAG TPA: SMI1/KNR4 family protein [Sphingomicrobium sp.]|nr:SMI1/KNR4 family protein [Sphingomicrobium sp.]
MKLLRPVLIFFLLLVSAILAPILWLTGRIAVGPNPRVRRRKQKPAKPLKEVDMLAAERRLGFSLPPDLREFYLCGRNHRAAPCGEFYSLKAAVKEYRMLTGKPYGPNGEDWPTSLYPFEDLLHGYAAYDLQTGLITEWDPDEIVGGNESKAAWKRSFQPTGKPLAEYLAR